MNAKPLLLLGDQTGKVLPSPTCSSSLVLAVGWRNGEVTLLDVEDARMLRSSNYGCEITSMCWIQVSLLDRSLTSGERATEGSRALGFVSELL